ncbi:hypothetical protein [Ammoniphilus sp. CFH 90114]|uniref:hypothetical protein n=1 Tax=Ammoniphilus sp. CFH 90114 TaxID=2493665 RepID=UPI0013E96230|nr:hypothetical protein [Ammoniphilus sp. CFH 90114]
MENTKTKINDKQGMENKELIIFSPEELKREELISVLAGLIKNYAIKKQQIK